MPEAEPEQFTVANLMPVSREPSAPAASSSESLDEETEAYIAQALTDVDLFSSYGLTQKAINLLENVLQRAPRHTPTLERLLDFYLGASNDRRTAELAAQLEQIHRERDDSTNAERFAELRQRYQDAAGLTPADLPPAAPAPPAAVETPPAVEAVFATSTLAPQAAVPPAAAPAEFEIPLARMEPEPAAEVPPAAPPMPIAAPPPAKPQLQPAASDEVDLSDEWEAITQGTDEPPPEPELPVAAPPPAAHMPVPESEPADEGELILELSPAPNATSNKSGPATTEEFLSDLAAEIEDMQAPEAPAAKPAHKPAAPKAKAPAKHAAPAAPPSRPVPQPVPSNGTEDLNELADVFEQFRSELDIMNEDADEDLETHYNLGVAYREMGLLDEAIGEFQKVSKAVQQGKPFPYAMNCAALLALAFMDKGEPKVASVWYRRALDTPDLNEEAILALRYDLGAALDLAGEASAALDNFRQVYAMNIDYRDVADRIAALQRR